MASKEKPTFSRVKHGFPPFIQPDSVILILGSFPSVKSREQAFFYGHPQNRFWPMVSAVFRDDAGKAIEERKAFLARHHIALYDVIESCDIVGSSDASIRNVLPADIPSLIQEKPIRLILLNGKKAGALFEKYLREKIDASIPYFIMPSTSPANAATSFAKLVSCYEKAINR